ncbi:DUF3014 domain-containing protein [Roseateles sp. DAIF2]|uniref:DUF3014 domain-containing protein n=1 Tax=Roseateles sp. DAIF2 TaxID=2714952 RepID=UPI0018A2AE2F|nr:DUF3014 domain-containing protein [Roseateles sp. DAIF2]QPF74590.1 DUF3014 domain-containing protein [Roseateles sp. DAIF2]
MLVAAAGAALLLAAGLITWQLATRGGMSSSSDGSKTAAGDSSRDSGVVTRPGPALPPPPVATTAAPTTTPPAAASAAAVTAPAPTPPAAAATPERKAPSGASTTPKYPVATRGRAAAAAPPLLPQEAVAATRQALGQRATGRFFYFDPLARRIVATVDGLGQQPAPTTLWLLRPTPGALKTNAAKDRLATANAERYRPFVRWVEGLDTAATLRLYRRFYPMLQQAWIEAGHADGHFNDRVVEVIDQLLATPSPRGPLRLKPAPARAASAGSSTPPVPRYEFADPALEALSTGQKVLLRMGPQHAQRLKLKLKALRAGLVKLDRPR